MKVCDKSPNKLQNFFCSVLKNYDKENVKKLMTSHKKQKKILNPEEQITQPKKKKPNITIDPDYSNPLLTETAHKTPEKLSEKAQKLKKITRSGKESSNKNLKLQENQANFEDFSFKGKSKENIQSDPIIDMKCGQQLSHKPNRSQAPREVNSKCEETNISKKLVYDISSVVFADNIKSDKIRVVHKRAKSENTSHSCNEKNNTKERLTAQDEKYQQYLRDMEFLRTTKPLNKQHPKNSESQKISTINFNEIADSSNNSTLELERIMVKLNKERYQLEKSIKLLDLKSKRLKEFNNSNASVITKQETENDDFLDRWKNLEAEDKIMKSQVFFERSSKRMKSENPRELASDPRNYEFQSLIKLPVVPLELKPANKRSNSFLEKESNYLKEGLSLIRRNEEKMDLSGMSKQKIDVLSQELNNMMINIFANKSEYKEKTRFY